MDPKYQPDKKGWEKSSGLGTVFCILVIGGVLALAVGGFLYRRNHVIQANARDWSRRVKEVVDVFWVKGYDLAEDLSLTL